jgi:hypothetical protein
MSLGANERGQVTSPLTTISHDMSLLAVLHGSNYVPDAHLLRKLIIVYLVRLFPPWSSYEAYFVNNRQSKTLAG